MQKTLSIVNIVALIVTIILNYLSNTGIFNGNTMSSVSAEYQNYFTPAGYAFSIWGLIYLGLAAFVIYHAIIAFKGTNENNVVLKVGWWFVISCLANSAWIFAWLYNYTGLSVIIMMVLLFSLVMIILRTRMELDDLPMKQIAFVWWPFSLYAGWITVALIANISAWLTKIQWDGFGISSITWTLILIIVAGVIYLIMTWQRNMREYALVGVWGLVAIAVANWTDEQSIVQTSIIVSVILFVSSSIHAIKNKLAVNRSK